MKAEVTAENRPACDQSQYVYTYLTCKTYKYQRRVQILVISLVKFLVVLLGQLAVAFVEPRPNLLRVRVHILTLTAGEVLVASRWDTERDLPISWFPVFYHSFPLLQFSPKFLATARCQPNGMSMMKFGAIRHAALKVV